MLYVQLDTNWPDHHKIIEAGLGGTGAYLMVVCYSAEDGRVHRDQLPADLLPRLGRLADLGLVVCDEEGWVYPLDSPPVRGRQRRWIPLSVRRAVMERDGYACLICGSFDDLTLDHIIPHSHGGPETVENLRVLCRPCNSRRGNRVDGTHS